VRAVCRMRGRDSVQGAGQLCWDVRGAVQSCGVAVPGRSTARGRCFGTGCLTVSGWAGLLGGCAGLRGRAGQGRAAPCGGGAGGGGGGGGSGQGPG